MFQTFEDCEGHAFSETELTAMLDLARAGMGEIIIAQNEALGKQ